MGEKKKVVKNAIIYVFSNFLIRAFNFFLLPLYTVFLSTEDYGTTNLAKNFSAVLSLVIVFSSYAAVARFYADYKNDKDKVSRLFGTLITFTIVSGAAFLTIIIAFRVFFTNIFFKGIPFMPTVLMVVVGACFSSLYNMYQYILKGTENGGKSAITSIVYFFIMLGFNLTFVVGFKLGANGVLLSTLLTNLLCSLYMVIMLIRDGMIRIGIDFAILKDVLKYSIPLMPHDLSTTITSLFSSVFINSSFNLSSLGLYSLACQFGDITDTIQSSVNTAFQPWFYGQMKEGGQSNKTDITKMSYSLTWLYGLMFLGIGLFSQDVIFLLLDARYALAWKLIPLIVVSYSIKTMYYFYVNILFYYKSAAKYIFTATLSSSILNVILSAILIPKYSATGSITADIITMFLRVGIIYFIARKFADIGYKIYRFVGIIAVTLTFMVVGLVFSITKYQESFSLMNFGYKILIYLLYIAFVLFTQRKAIMIIVQNIRARRK